MCLHPNQATLIVGDQSGTIHVWDLTTDHNEQLVKGRYYTIEIGNGRQHTITSLFPSLSDS